MSDLTLDYSGIAINYDYASTAQFTLSGGQQIAQKFVLPVDYVRGTTSIEERIPDITGFQILVNIDDETTAGFEWSIGYSSVAVPVASQQIVTVQSGTTTGAYKSGNVWFDIIFDEPITVGTDQLSVPWVMVLTPLNINYAPYIQFPNQGFDPNNQGYQTQEIINAPYVSGLIFGFLDETSSLDPATTLFPDPTLFPSGSSGSGSAASFNFRLLSLVADGGTDFLGNPYRSVVSTAPVDNLATGAELGGLGTYWLSPAQPAADAVASLYFDMRATQTTPQYGEINIVPDPSFEYNDTPTITTWTDYTQSGTITAFGVVTSPDNGVYAASGANMLKISANNVLSGNYVQATTADYLPIYSGQWYSGCMWIGYFPTQANSYARIQFDWYSGTPTSHSYISSSYGSDVLSPIYASNPPTSGIGIAQLTAIAPVGATLMRVTMTMTNYAVTTQNLGCYVDAVCVVAGRTLPTYFDGDSYDCEWNGKPGYSTSIQTSVPILMDEPVVVDAIVFEPLFADQHYTVYYSNDDDGLQDTPSSTDEWENKLWTMATSVVTNFGNETEVLPQPISAKYIKIELTNPQLQAYNPGNFALPITYKTFPSWVQNYFLSQVDYPSWDADQVVVQSDALTTLYTPDTSDLIKQPAVPNTPNPASYTTSSSTGLDNTTLGQINLNTNPYGDTLGTQVDASTTIGAIAASQTDNVIDGAQQVTEGGSTSYPPITTVSSLQRDSVLAELLAPDMYFYYTCRHAYMIKTATLSDNKAYFFGVNNITFLRSQGSVSADTPVYTETGADMANSTMNDFYLDPSTGWWETYDAS